jgi:hypothetical protein
VDAVLRHDQVHALGRPDVELPAGGDHRLRLVGPHPGRVDHLPGPDLDVPVALQVADERAGDPLALPQEPDDPRPGSDQRPEVRRGPGDVHRVPGVVDLAVVVADRADQGVLAQRRRDLQRPAPGEVAVVRQPAAHAGRRRQRHQVVEQHPGADVRPLPDPVLQRVEERQCPGEVGRELTDDEPALPQRLVHQPEVEHLQVAQAAVQQLAGPARRSAGQVPPVDEPDPQSPGRGVQRRTGADHPAPDDQDVELLLGHPVQRFGPGLR